jgi:hypothetical protein
MFEGLACWLSMFITSPPVNNCQVLEFGFPLSRQLNVEFQAMMTMKLCAADKVSFLFHPIHCILGEKPKHLRDACRGSAIYFLQAHELEEQKEQSEREFQYHLSLQHRGAKSRLINASGAGPNWSWKGLLARAFKLPASRICIWGCSEARERVSPSQIISGQFNPSAVNNSARRCD